MLVGITFSVCWRLVKVNEKGGMQYFGEWNTTSERSQKGEGPSTSNFSQVITKEMSERRYIFLRRYKF